MRREHIEWSDHKCLLTSSKINGICQCNCRVLLRPVDETPFGQDKSINMTCTCDCTSKSTNKIGRLSFYPCFEILFRLNIVLWQYVTVLYNYVSISSSLDYTWWTIIHRKTMGVLVHCHHIPISGWWFQTFFIFHNIWDNPYHWLIFFKMVKTTNQITSHMIDHISPATGGDPHNAVQMRRFLNDDSDSVNQLGCQLTVNQKI